MRKLSSDKIVEFGAQLNLEITDNEVDEIEDAANAMLSGMQAVEEVALKEGSNTGERAWSEAEEPENNAIITNCNVSPTRNEGLLSDYTFGIKDNIAVAGVPMSCASETMEGYIPGKDATVITRLREHGASIAAKTNHDEFGNVGQGTNGFRGPISNPYDSKRTAGGSSGGSAAAVVNDQVDVALGTDTGGSIRIPAAYCGVVGLKSTFGIVPNTGVFENAYTQDSVGPITETVEEAARVLEAITGKDKRCPATFEAAGRDEYQIGGYVDAVRSPPDPSEISIGVLREGFEGPTSDEVINCVEESIDQLKDVGITVRDCSIERYDYARAINRSMTYVANAALWRQRLAPLRRGGVMDEDYQTAFALRSKSGGGDINTLLKARLIAGNHLIETYNGKYYAKAQSAREVLRSEFDEVLSHLDVLVSPTLPTVAPKLEDCPPNFDYGRNTKLANITRLPAITMPNGTVDGLPVGIQLTGRAFDDANLLGIAEQIETIFKDSKRDHGG